MSEARRRSRAGAWGDGAAELRLMRDNGRGRAHHVWSLVEGSVGQRERGARVESMKMCRRRPCWSLVAGGECTSRCAERRARVGSCNMTEPGQAVRPAASLSVASTPTSRSAFHRSCLCLLPAGPLLRLFYPDYSTITSCASVLLVIAACSGTLAIHILVLSPRDRTCRFALYAAIADKMDTRALELSA
jgi:hypothetical protein